MTGRPDVLSVLIVDDDEADRKIVRRRLANSKVPVNVLEAECINEGIELANREQADVVLLDLMLQDTSGLGTLHRFLQSVPNIPVVVLTGLADDDVALKAIECGAQDFIAKDDLNNPWLLRCLRNAIQRHQLYKRLNTLSHSDPLTGLPNRAMLEKSLGGIFSSLQETIEPFAVAFVDLDDFKLVNDCFGHGEGDRVLIEFAARLRDCVGSGDIIARFGGDEFVIILNGVNCDSDVTLFLDRMTAASNHAMRVQGKDIFLSASIGYVTYCREYGDYQRMLRDADTAMYRAKKAGKSEHRKFCQSMHHDALETVGMDAQLRHALEHDEFALAYQPVVDLRTGMTLKFEALLRWHHPTQGLVMPLAFVPHAERTGLIVPMGLWVLESACQQSKEWDLLFPGNEIQICVNVSPVQILSTDFDANVFAILKKHDVATDRIVLEVTESTIMEDADRASGVLQTLRENGIRISIDDFGTGYSSLSKLHQFGFDCLKIDRSFVRELLTAGYADLLVQTILLLAQSVGLDVIAEGIETQEESDRLLELGCSLGQGYLLGRPMFSDAATSFLSESIERETPASFESSAVLQGAL